MKMMNGEVVRALEHNAIKEYRLLELAKLRAFVT
jgi:hypothetical protein